MTNENRTIPAATAACPGIAYGPVTTFSNPPPADGWLIDGSLVYKLDETGSMNAYEVNVTMARGSRKHDGPRVALAEHIRAVLAAATPAASVRAKPVAAIPDAELLSIAASRGVQYVFGQPSMTAVLQYGREVAKRSAALAAVPAVQQPAEGGWIANTGVQPVDDDVLVEVEVREGRRGTALAGVWRWAVHEVRWDIIRWRPAAPTQAEGV